MTEKSRNILRDFSILAIMKETEIQSGHLDKTPICKECNSCLDGFTGEKGRGPKDGDINVCAYCGTIGRYKNECSEIEPLTKDELINMRDTEKETWMHLMQYKQVADSVKIKLQGVTPNITGNNNFEIK